MSRDLNKLEPVFKETVKELLQNVAALGHTLRPFFTTRSLEDQAKLWRQSRCSEEIDQAMRMLEREGAPALAGVIQNVGPQHGRWATNAMPGTSWHQWGEAVDCFVVSENGRAVWSAKHPAYQAYAEEAKKLGLNAGFFWPSKDAVHVQQRNESVRSSYTWAGIEAEMLRRSQGGLL